MFVEEQPMLKMQQKTAPMAGKRDWLPPWPTVRAAGLPPDKRTPYRRRGQAVSATTDGVQCYDCFLRLAASTEMVPCLGGVPFAGMLPIKRHSGEGTACLGPNEPCWARWRAEDKAREN